MNDLIGILVKKLNNDLQRYSDHEAKKIGLTHAQMSIIDFLYRNENYGDLYQTDVEHEFNIQKSSATTLLKLMEKKDLIVRTASKEDSRYKKILLTPTAHQYAKKVNQFYHQTDEELKVALAKDADGFVKNLNHLHAYLENKLKS